ncbi:hypothetical protein M0804_010611 [Polistes exclamans]|nr:hypothetical protein M0804_010611 [Polistes exclamans]
MELYDGLDVEVPVAAAAAADLAIPDTKRNESLGSGGGGGGGGGEYVAVPNEARADGDDGESAKRRGRRSEIRKVLGKKGMSRGISKKKEKKKKRKGEKAHSWKRKGKMGVEETGGRVRYGTVEEEGLVLGGWIRAEL